MLGLSTWDYDELYGDHRTAMFAAFIHGVAQNVGTNFWMKLDVDTVPTCPDPMWDKEDFKHDLVANGWGFTKVKNDKVKKPHWLNRLDEWWFEELGKSGIGEKFPKIKEDKHRHSRHIRQGCVVPDYRYSRVGGVAGVYGSGPRGR